MAKKKKEEIVEQINNNDVEPLLLPTHGIYEYIDLLLDDKTTGKKIIFAEDEYAEDGFLPEDHYSKEIMEKLISEKKINYRYRKSIQDQKDRTKKKAEVFTPTWVCKQMIDMCEPPEDWQELIESTWLEITCGEAPYITSRYDTTTGDDIDIPNRTGILDRKFHAVNYYSHDHKEWCNLAIKALQSTYGYEYQGDNLFIARVNVLRCFVENYRYQWHRKPTKDLIETAIDIITWNFWQMDGLNDKVPNTNIPAKIRDWSKSYFDDDYIIDFRTLKGPVDPEILAQEKIDDALEIIKESINSVSKKSQTKLINDIKKKLDDSFDSKDTKTKTKKKSTTKKKENNKDEQLSLFDV